MGTHILALALPMAAPVRGADAWVGLDGTAIAAAPTAHHQAGDGRATEGLDPCRLPAQPDRARQGRNICLKPSGDAT